MIDTRTAVLLAALGTTACTTVRITPGPASAGPPPRTIAVLAFRSDLPDISGRAEDGCVEGIIVAGANPVERQRVADVLAEKTLSRGGEESAEYYQKIGELTGAEAFIVGTVNTRSGRAKNVSGRLIDARSGRMVRLVDLRGAGEDDGYSYGRRLCVALTTGSDP